MKRHIFFLFAFSAVLFSCKKGTEVTNKPTVDCSKQSYKDSVALIDNQTIHEYIADSSLTVDSTANGLYYIIADSGRGTLHPGLNSSITVKYLGYLTNGTIFSRVGNAPLTGKLSDLIKGWQYGIPLLKKGGKIKLIIPSALGYGCQTVGVIPGNSVLIFDIELLDFF